MSIEIWCIEDLQDPSPGAHHANTESKDAALKDIFRFAKAPDGVVAFGTAGYPTDDSQNGCVAIGGTIFLHQPSGDARDPSSNWSWDGHMERLIPSGVSEAFYKDILDDLTLMDSISKKMLPAPTRPAPALRLIASSHAVGISSVNIASTAKYADVDNEAIAKAKEAGASNIVSVETTHGVIRAQRETAPFLFVTGIPNRVGHFGDEAAGSYPQNFAAAHNAGVALASLLARIAAEFLR